MFSALPAFGSAFAVLAVAVARCFVVLVWVVERPSATIEPELASFGRDSTIGTPRDAQIDSFDPWRAR